MKSLLYVILEVFSFHTLSAWIKRQIVNTNIQGLFKSKKSGVCAEWKSYFPLFTEVMEYLIHYV